MSIFGDLDVDEISDNPFEIPDNTYFVTCVKSEFGEKDGTRSFRLGYKIEMAESDYHGLPISDWFSPINGETESASDLTPAQKQKLSHLKKRLREGFDVSAEKMATLNPSELLGRNLYVTTRTSSDKNPAVDRKYVNVVSALSPRLYEERTANNANAASSSLGML